MPKRPRHSALPFGIGGQKPKHYREMLRILWDNRKHPGYAMRVLQDGVCDGCALGTTGLRDWTMDGTHLCLVRLNLLRLNTMDALDPAALDDVPSLVPLRQHELHELGRLPYPMRRRRGEPGFTRVSWDEALQDIGARLGAVKPERIACYLTSRGIANEVYFAAQKAWRFLGSPHIDNAARLCHSPSTAAMKKVLGVSASTCSYRDWYGSDVVVFFGSNPANDQPVALKYLAEAKKQGTKVLVVNTFREPGMDRYWVPSSADSAIFGTRIADAFFHVAAGGDHAFIYAVQKLLLDRSSMDQAFIDRHTTGFDDYRAALDALDVDELIARAGTTREEVETFAEYIEDASTGVFVWSMGLTQHATGTQTVEAVCNLGLSQGFVGRERCGMMPIRGHSGVQGGAEMGAYATVFPGGRPIDNAGADALEGHWGFRPPVRVGMDTCSMLEAALSGRLDALYAIGGNFLDTLPQPTDVHNALARIPLRIHQDILMSRAMLVEPKDVVYLLPARTRYEHRGGVTETTTERRVIYSPHVPGHEVGEAREEWRIAIDIARAARPDQAALLDYDDAAAIRRDIGAVIEPYAPIVELEKKGDQFQWGGPRLCEGGVFPLPDGRARFTHAEPRDTRRTDGRLLLGTRRGKQFNSIVQADNDQLTGADRDHLFMNVDDMKALDLGQDQRVVVTSDYGTVAARAFAADITRGNVQMHWPEANPLIAAGIRDPGGRIPDYNAVVQVQADEVGLVDDEPGPGARAGVHGIVRVTGGGAAESVEDALAIEEPLEIRLAGDTWVITMRTPGHDRELTLGLLLAEGVITTLDDVGGVAHCGRPGEEGYGNAIDVQPGPGHVLDAEQTAPARRGTLINSACGVCGRQSIDDLMARVTPRAATRPIEGALLLRAAELLADNQPGFARTGGLHAAAAVGPDGSLLSAHEDVGRHNAVDKVMGTLLLTRQSPPHSDTQPLAVLAVSGRISFEIVQKAAASGVWAVCGVSAPTSLAVDLAQRAGIVLAGFVREDRYNLYAHADRVTFP